MRNQPYVMRDPTAEISPVLRERLAPGKDLSEATIGLLSISKERSDEFLDSVAKNLSDQGLNVLRFRKPTYTRPAPEAIIQEMVERCDVAVVGLAD
ncbi:MAG: hypothetical protein CMM59_16355 [Rhodospirillaceae bacterium]|nr:hypothetical protein [Rhodospirillaceae bacterium]|tara:strand:+ start:212 stop:499 length:288 start_codon:yes stop_codon:yes gene_type:complete